MRMLAQPLLQNSPIQVGKLQQLHKFFRLSGLCILNLHRALVSLVFEPHALHEELGLFELPKVFDVHMLRKLFLDVGGVYRKFVLAHHKEEFTENGKLRIYLLRLLIVAMLLSVQCAKVPHSIQGLIGALEILDGLTIKTQDLTNGEEIFLRAHSGQIIVRNRHLEVLRELQGIPSQGLVVLEEVQEPDAKIMGHLRIYRFHGHVCDGRAHRGHTDFRRCGQALQYGWACGFAKKNIYIWTRMCVCVDIYTYTQIYNSKRGISNYGSSF